MARYVRHYLTLEKERSNRDLLSSVLVGLGGIASALVICFMWIWLLNGQRKKETPPTLSPDSGITNGDVDTK
jgi:hypothetical protein